MTNENNKPYYGDAKPIDMRKKPKANRENGKEVQDLCEKLQIKLQDDEIYETYISTMCPISAGKFWGSMISMMVGIPLTLIFIIIIMPAAAKIPVDLHLEVWILVLLFPIYVMALIAGYIHIFAPYKRDIRLFITSKRIYLYKNWKTSHSRIINRDDLTKVTLKRVIVATNKNGIETYKYDIDFNFKSTSKVTIKHIHRIFAETTQLLSTDTNINSSLINLSDVFTKPNLLDHTTEKSRYFKIYPPIQNLSKKEKIICTALAIVSLAFRILLTLCDL